MQEQAARRISWRMPAGLLTAAAAVLLGLLLEGGHIGQILQPTAAVIVLGGTLGALLIQFPLGAVRAAFRQAAMDVPNRTLHQNRTEQLMRFALQARRAGLVSLDPELKQIPDPFFRRALMLAIDGIAPREVRDIMELELAHLEEGEEQGAKVLEAAGGYAPTIGILGAVLGLIQVMQRLDNISEVGRGIAVAFTATLYGVGLANLLFLPLAGKLRLRAREAHVLREITLEGVMAMAEGAGPRTMRERIGSHATASLPKVVAR